jgi:hypothetical protein
MGNRISALMALSLTCLSSTVLAQNNPELGDVRVEPAPVVATTSSGPVTGTVATVGTDHAAVVGHLGIGHFGFINLPVARGAMEDGGGILRAPTIGARYWLDERMALEGALGIGFESGSTTTKTGNTSIENSEPSLFGLGLHAALPLVFATTQHFAFEVIPELNFGFASGSDGDGMNKVDLSGVLLQLGARVGAEIQFGFIDIPQLALQATVGLHLSYEGRSASNDAGSVSTSRLLFGTTLQNTPWDIFQGGIAAIYYL